MSPKLPDAWKPAKALPKELGDCIDLLVGASRERKRREAYAKEAEKEEARIEEHMIATFEAQKINGARGKLGSVTMQEKDVGKVVDKEALGKWMAKHKAWDLMYGRVVEEACNARWEDGITIDGIEKFHKKRITLSEVK